MREGDDRSWIKNDSQFFCGFDLSTWFGLVVKGMEDINLRRGY
jgi:hypothetical protein